MAESVGWGGGGGRGGGERGGVGTADSRGVGVERKEGGCWNGWTGLWCGGREGGVETEVTYGGVGLNDLAVKGGADLLSGGVANYSFFFVAEQKAG